MALERASPAPRSRRSRSGRRTWRNARFRLRIGLCHELPPVGTWSSGYASAACVRTRVPGHRRRPSARGRLEVGPYGGGTTSRARPSATSSSRVQSPAARPARCAAPSGGQVRHGELVHCPAADVGLQLHEVVVLGGAAVGEQRREPGRLRGAHRPRPRPPPGRRSTPARRVRGVALRAQCQPADQARGLGVPPRRAEAVEGGHEVDAVAVGVRARGLGQRRRASSERTLRARPAWRRWRGCCPRTRRSGRRPPRRR